MPGTFQHLSHHVRRFRSDAGGNVYLMFALLIVPLAVVTILSFDFGRGNSIRSSLTSALDAGLSFAASRIHRDDDDVREAFQQAFKANLPQALRETRAQIVIDRDNGRLAAKASTSLRAGMDGVLKNDHFEIAAESQLKLATLRAAKADATRKAPEAAARMEDMQARMRDVLRQHFPQLEHMLPPDGSGPQIDPAAAEQLARQILQQMQQR